MTLLLQKVTAIFIASAGFFGIANAATPSYPDRPISLVVPFAPGGATDLLARLIGDKLSKKLGQTVMVENKPGASTMLGAAAVARRPPDGYTLLLTATGFLINPSIRTDMPYDTLKDFALVTTVAKGPLVMVVNPSLPVKTVQEFVAYAKENPGKLAFGSSGVGGGSHIAVELLKSMAKIDILHVPYGGAAPASVALIGGQTSVGIDAMTVYLPYIQAKKVRALAVTSKRRSSLLPDVPTLAESGYPKYDQQGWWGVLVPAGTPKEIIQKLNTTIVEILSNEDVKEFLHEQALEVSTNTSEEAASALETYVHEAAKVIKRVDLAIQQ